MSNIKQWRVMSWDDGARRYVHQYTTEFLDTWDAGRVRSEVMRTDPNLEEGHVIDRALRTVVLPVR